VIDGLVYDVGEFAPSHPGGRIIEAYRGKGTRIVSSVCFWCVKTIDNGNSRDHALNTICNRRRD
jgi:hypothetical protein